MLLHTRYESNIYEHYIYIYILCIPHTSWYAVLLSTVRERKINVGFLARDISLSYFSTVAETLIKKSNESQSVPRTARIGHRLVHIPSESKNRSQEVHHRGESRLLKHNSYKSI